MTLAKREATLRTLLSQNANESRLLKAAERVREARIQVLRAKIGEMPSVIRTSEQNRRVAKLERQIESLMETPLPAFLEECQRFAK